MKTIWLTDESLLALVIDQLEVGDVVANRESRDVKLIISIDPIKLEDAPEFTRRRVLADLPS